MKKYLVLSAALATMIFCGADLAMATGGHGGGGHDGGSTGGGGSSTSEKDGSPGADRDAASDAEGGSSNEASLADCERLTEQRKIGQTGPISGSDLKLAGRDCDMPLTGEAK